jgi:hypothetical protein
MVAQALSEKRMGVDEHNGSLAHWHESFDPAVGAERHNEPHAAPQEEAPYIMANCSNNRIILQ